MGKDVTVISFGKDDESGIGSWQRKWPIEGIDCEVHCLRTVASLLTTPLAWSL